MQMHSISVAMAAPAPGPSPPGKHNTLPPSPLLPFSRAHPASPCPSCAPQQRLTPAPMPNSYPSPPHRPSSGPAGSGHRARRLVQERRVQVRAGRNKIQRIRAAHRHPPKHPWHVCLGIILCRQNRVLAQGRCPPLVCRLFVVNDPVMGGKSTSVFGQHHGRAIFNGTVRIVPQLKAPASFAFGCCLAAARRSEQPLPATPPRPLYHQLHAHVARRWRPDPGPAESGNGMLYLARRVSATPRSRRLALARTSPTPQRSLAALAVSLVEPWGPRCPARKDAPSRLACDRPPLVLLVPRGC